MKLTPIEIVRGRDFEMMCVFDDNIALWNGRAQVRASAAMTSQLLANFTVVIGAYASQTDPLTNKTFMGCPVNIRIGKATTTTISPDTGYWDLALTDLNGDFKTYVGGPVAIVDFPTTVA